ncbi:MAG: DUF222 domain-containing protein, partial [Nitriliruptorales bacterium]|nr:DUF222 domain-containing protein [Nitriliruptorales bacterium]
MTLNQTRSPAGGMVPVAYSVDRLGVLEDAVDQLVEVPVERLDEAGLRAELATIEKVRRRLQARAARATSTLTGLVRRQADDGTPGSRREAQRATQQTHTQLMDELDWTPTEVKDAERLGRQLARTGPLSDATDAGEVPPKNAKTLSRLLSRIEPDVREAAEQRLLEAAKTQTPGVFADTCRQVLAELDPDEAERAEHARHQRRFGSVTTTADGMTRIYAELCGVDGALVNKAVDAFRRPDAPGEHRRPPQATADAIVAMARAALEGGTPATNRGVRPHVVCTVPIQSLIDGNGPVDLDGTTLPLDAIRHLLDGAGWSFVVTAAHGTPIAVSKESGTVPVGLWRALQLRDQTCIADGCDIPAAWCDVMHLDTPHRHGGPLTLDNTGLGCRHHHRAYDHGRL